MDCFEAIDVMALMPELEPFNFWEPPLSWIDRADAVYVLLGSLAGMPADSPAGEEYVAALACPGVVAVLMEPCEM